ncbi:MAG: acyl-CoA dehydrogenase family protein [Rhodococcus sp. (in: high G+C Gram-positive bacteria)]
MTRASELPAAGGGESDERQMLRDSVRSLVAKFGVSPADTADTAGTAGSVDDALWNRIHQQIGGAAVSIAEEYGGAGGTIGDMAVVLEELGAALVASPMLGTAVTATALTRNADDAGRARLLPRIAEDGCTASVVFDPTAVVDAVGAGILLGVEDGRLVEYDLSTVTVHRLDTMDPTRAIGSVDLAGASRTDIGDAGDTVEVALLLAAAEQIGAAKRCLSKTITYTGERVQFGRPVGSFQALKHRMADLHVAVEAARALVLDAAASFDDGHCDVGAVAAASISASEALTSVAGEAVQMHGGIGVTWEHDISWYFKRAHSSRYLFGSPQDRMARLRSAALPV